MTTPLHLVLDTNVCLDLFVFDDPVCLALAQALASGQLVAYYDDVCRGEWQRVLTYPQLGLSVAEQQAAVARYDTRLQAWPPTRRRSLIPLPRCADEDDQKFMELAYAASANVLLTRDNALLRLARPNARLGLFQILAPQAFIQRTLQQDAALV